MNDACLMVLNPRRIPRVLRALDALRGIDVCYFTAMTESQIVHPMRRFVKRHDYRVLSLVSDDVVVSQAAINNILEHHVAGQCTTGYCNLSLYGEWSGRVNLCTEPLPTLMPSVKAYSFPLAVKVPDGMRSHFSGHCLTTMHRDLWRAFPYDCYGRDGRGTAADYHMSWRLAEGGIPIYAYGPMQRHLKRYWPTDRKSRWPLLIGKIPADVRLVRNG